METKDTPATEQQKDSIKAHEVNRMADKIRLRKAYVRGEGALEKLAERAGVPGQTARKWFTAERWDLLRRRYDQNSLRRLQGEDDTRADAQQMDTSGTQTERQLRLVDAAMLACDDADEWAKLSKSKVDLLKALHFERTGTWPGTQQQRKGRGPQQRSAQPFPDPLVLDVPGPGQASLGAAPALEQA